MYCYTAVFCYPTKLTPNISSGMISGLLNASIDINVTFDTSSVTTLNCSKLNPYFRQCVRHSVWATAISKLSKILNQHEGCCINFNMHFK